MGRLMNYLWNLQASGLLLKCFHHAFSHSCLPPSLQMLTVILEPYIVTVVLAAPKKKQPRIRTHPDEGAHLQAGLITSTPSAVSSSHGLTAPQSKEIDQSEVCLVAEDHPVGVVDEDSVKIEPTTSATLTNPGPASSIPIGAPVLPVPAASTQHDSCVEQENEKLEKKMANEEVTRTISDENKSDSVVPIDKKPAALKLDSPTTGIQEVDAATITSPVPSDAATEVDIAKRLVLVNLVIYT
jgi:hypothetical protein